MNLQLSENLNEFIEGNKENEVCLNALKDNIYLVDYIDCNNNFKLAYFLSNLNAGVIFKDDSIGQILKNE